MKKLTGIFFKYNKPIYNFVTVILVLVALGTLYNLLEVFPTSNDECLWQPKRITEDSVAYFFRDVKPDGVSYNAGIRDGDQLININGVDTYSSAVAQYTLNQVAEGDTAIYKVIRNGKIFEAKVRIKKLISIQGVAFTLFGLIWLLVGYVVVMAKPLGTPQRLFYSIGVSMIFYTLLPFQSSVAIVGIAPFSNNILTLLYFLGILGGAYFPFVFIHFFWVFPKRKKILDRKYTIKILYLIPTIIFVLSCAFYFNPHKQGGFPFPFLTIFSFVVLSFATLITGLISLFRSYRRLETKKEKKSIFLILISYMLGVASVLYYNAIANALPRSTVFNSPEYFLPIILIIFIPISFGYSIFKYSLLDVSDVVKNTIVYGAAMLSIAAIYFLAIFIFGQYVSQAASSEYQAVIAGVVFIGFAMIFQSTKEKFQNLITAKFYPEQFAFQNVLVKFSREISTVVRTENILDSIKHIFSESLKLKKFGIMLKSFDNEYCELKLSKNLIIKNKKVNELSKQILHFYEKKEKLKLLPVIEQSDFEKLFGEDADEFIKQEVFTIIPLILKSKVIGLMLFGLKPSGLQFAEKDLELLLAVANQIAISIENSRLYESEAEKMKMERDLENAKQIQESLLPHSIPQINSLSITGKMVPAMQVGGDYYDLIPVGKSKLFVIVGDVSGKGLSASFYMSKMQTMMKLFAVDGRDPKDVLIEVNKLIYESIEKNWFITVALGLFDTEKMTLEFCRAGHTPLLMVENGVSKRFQPQGIGVGLESGKIFASSLEQIEIPLRSGQLFAFFSDGITEAMNSKLELFGTSNVENVLIKSAALDINEIETNIFNALLQFRGDAQQNDDITSVLVKVNK